jgi:hypothetical protein
MREKKRDGFVWGCVRETRFFFSRKYSSEDPPYLGERERDEQRDEPRDEQRDAPNLMKRERDVFLFFLPRDGLFWCLCAKETQRN